MLTCTTDCSIYQLKEENQTLLVLDLLWAVQSSKGTQVLNTETICPSPTRRATGWDLLQTHPTLPLSPSSPVPLGSTPFSTRPPAAPASPSSPSSLTAAGQGPRAALRAHEPQPASKRPATWPGWIRGAPGMAGSRSRQAGLPPDTLGCAGTDTVLPPPHTHTD